MSSPPKAGRRAAFDTGGGDSEAAPPEKEPSGWDEPDSPQPKPASAPAAADATEVGDEADADGPKHGRRRGGGPSAGWGEPSEDGDTPAVTESKPIRPPSPGSGSDDGNVAQFIPDLEEEEEEELIRQVAEAPTQAHAIKSISELEGGKMDTGH